MDCEHCHNKFSTRPNLVHHQKTARYCLKIRNVQNKKYSCTFCNKEYTSNFRLSTHVLKCEKSSHELINVRDKVKVLESENKILLTQLIDQKQTIKDLQNKLENIALSAVKRPTKNTQINNYIQHLQPVTDKHFIDNIHHLTIDHILKGPEGYAQYALEYPLKDRVLCVDYSRRKVKFKDTDGNIITDPEMSNLATKFFNSIKDKNKELIIECGGKLKENFGDELDTIVKIFDYKTGVERSSEGERTDFHHDFVKQVCSQTIKD
jgi:hypothetical protein